MAKADFCFTYYDGDAARDMAHMNRLERGAYSDIIISQRKFGHLTKDQIKKILGKDFDECFGSIELVLKRTDKGLFFIDWLDVSEKKAKTHSKRQSDNRNGSTKQQPNNNQTEPNTSKILPLEDGNGDEGRDEIINEDWIKWGNLILDDCDQDWQAMRGRKMNKDEMDIFLSVAIRCNWKMETQSAFRRTLNGFKVNGQNGKTNGIGKKQQHNIDLAKATLNEYSDVFGKQPNG